LVLHLVSSRSWGWCWRRPPSKKAVPAAQTVTARRTRRPPQSWLAAPRRGREAAFRRVLLPHLPLGDANRIVVGTAVRDQQNFLNLVAARLAHATARPSERKHDAARQNQQVKGVADALIERRVLRVLRRHFTTETFVALTDLPRAVRRIKQSERAACASLVDGVAELLGVHVILCGGCRVDIVGQRHDLLVASKRINPLPMYGVAPPSDKRRNRPHRKCLGVWHGKSAPE